MHDLTYTVKQLAQLSGVSIRTLRFYHEIGLLNPAYIADNGYRYYKEEQLLLLQQILFFRELGFQLNDIQKIMVSNEFDKITTLETHRIVIANNIIRSQQLIETIDKTIAHLKGKNKMESKELYYGFNSAKQAEYEKYLVDKGIVKLDVMDKYREKFKSWKEEDFATFKKDGEDINNALVLAMSRNLEPTSDDVQNLIQQHYAWITRSWTPNRESYIGLSQLYTTPEFRQFFDRLHPELLDFIVKAMKYFAETNLS